MAERNFLNVNDFIGYPFIEVLDDQDVGYPARPKGIVDAGFILGMDAKFFDTTDSIYLKSIEVTATKVRFDFRCTVATMAALRWLFEFDKTAAFGTTVQVQVSVVASAEEVPEYGAGFLTIGDLQLTLLANLSQAVHVFPVLKYQIEPARIQNLARTYVRQLFTGNETRGCGVPCCEPSGSSSFSSSMSSSSSGIEDDTFVELVGMVGALEFVPGFNAKIDIDIINNAIVFGAELGAGQGEQCEDGSWVDFRITPVSLEKISSVALPVDCADCGTFIRSINGQGIPDGNLRLRGGDGITVVSEPGLITITPDVNSRCLN